MTPTADPHQTPAASPPLFSSRRPSFRRPLAPLRRRPRTAPDSLLGPGLGSAAADIPAGAPAKSPPPLVPGTTAVGAESPAGAAAPSWSSSTSASFRSPAS